MRARVIWVPGFVGRFRNRMINVHPALLPAFPGIDAVQQAIDHGSKITGVTVLLLTLGLAVGFPLVLLGSWLATRRGPAVESEPHA